MFEIIKLIIYNRNIEIKIIVIFYFFTFDYLGGVALSTVHRE